ncbi:MAG: PKD domain-containing protein, partial [Flavobacteriales bacterium]|nr:PKD domain-containing protein [Flavobacteriales bacterium]
IMADGNNALVSPVGAVWKYIRTNWPSIGLYSADGSHPSQTGSYAAACCFYSIIFEKDPTLLTYNYTLNQVDADSIKMATKRIVFDSLANWNVGNYDPIANFTTTTNGLSASFTDTSTVAVTYEWDFGDSTTSSVPNPNHIYSGDGNYNVCLVISDNCGNTDTTCAIVSIGCANPGSQFFYVDSNLQVNFTNTSTDYDSTLWNFGNGITDTSENQSIIFDTTGSYTICLITYNSCGSDTSCETITLSCPLPVANFSQTTNNLELSLIDNTINADSVLWNFGDGTTTSNSPITHIYNTAGSYVITLIAYNGCGTDTMETLITLIDGTGIQEKEPCEIELVNDQNVIQLKPNNSCIANDYFIEIYDLSGRLIKMGKINLSTEININNFNSGVYIYQISSAENTQSGKLIIK